MPVRKFDLTIPADNGMRRGRTTGTCAAAAAKAAVLALFGYATDEVDVCLPETDYVLTVPIARVISLAPEEFRAEVLKDAGDDPDVTDGATIFCEVKNNNVSTIRLLAAEGVGVVTQAGIRVPIGEPAINPVPRKMILHAVIEALESVGRPGDYGVDVAIGCVNGAHLAQKTFNPRLGIIGGISILGTTGIVEPMSLAAYQASVEVYIRVGMANTSQAAFLPGNIGISFANLLGLERKRTIHISNFLGFALDAAEATIREYGSGFETLWILGHPGKLCKALDGHWDTHSKVSGMAMPALAKFASTYGLTNVEDIAISNTVEAAIDVIRALPGPEGFWEALEQHLAAMFALRVPSIPSVQVRLFDMAGKQLSQQGAI
jgi:cobalt-precorrin-5B (C1)-methyltransferase